MNHPSGQDSHLDARRAQGNPRPRATPSAAEKTTSVATSTHHQPGRSTTATAKPVMTSR